MFSNPLQDAGLFDGYIKNAAKQEIIPLGDFTCPQKRFEYRQKSVSMVYFIH